MSDDLWPLTQDQRTLFSVMLGGKTEARLVALGCFYERYRTVLAKVLEAKLRLQPVDADEILNEFMLKKLLKGSFIEKYIAWHDDPNNGQRRFRQYLSRSIQHFAIDWIRTQKPAANLDNVATPEVVGAELEAACDAEWVQDMLALALRRTRQYYLKKGDRTHWEVFLELWIEPDFLGTPRPTHDEVAGYGLTQKVSSVLTNAQRTFMKNWKEVLAEDLQTADSEIIEGELRAARRHLGMVKHIDARQLLLQIVRTGDVEHASVNSQQLSRLFGLASNQFSDLLPSEQEMLFSCYIGLPLDELLPSKVIVDLPSELKDVAFETVLGHPTTDAATLRVISRGLSGAMREQADIPGRIAGMMRYLVIACAEQRFGDYISTVPKERLKEGIDAALHQESWIDASSRQRLAEYLETSDA